MTTQNHCWCGNTALEPFGAGYMRCRACETLVSEQRPGDEIARVADDERDFYGRSYWFDHQERDLASINITVRARTDLPERCAYWLQTLMRYRLPPARALEVGCGHGGFVAVLRWAGFDASGLELSPWVVEFARQAFEIPIAQGTLEEQAIAPGSLDLLVLLDVVEHLPDPAQTLRRGLELLAPDGQLMIQVPCYPAGASYAELAERKDPFLKMLIPNEHVYLFSQAAMGRMLAELGAGHQAFEPAMAPHDLLVLASRQPLARVPAGEAERALGASPGARMVQALADAQQQVAQLASLVAHKDRDLAAAQQWAAAMKQSIAAKDAYSITLRERLEQKEAEISSVAAHLGEKEQALKALTADSQRQITEREQALGALRAFIAEREQLIGELQARIQLHERPLIAIIEQTSSRVKRGYPWAKWQAKRVRRRVRRLAGRLFRG